MIKIGAVSYLNAKVLIQGLQPARRYTLEVHVPSVLVRKLRQGELDVAMVSSIEYFRRPDYLIIPDVAIAGHREMWSVKLFHRVPLASARRLGLDPASESSNALLQIILQEKMQLGIDLARMEPGEDPLHRPDLDGFLKIGDDCLRFQPPAGYKALDLTSEWFDFTQLPFVFAVWLARKGVDLQGVNQDLFLAKREGLRQTEAIARAEAPGSGLDYQRLKTYLSKIVHYDLGRAELGGLALFRRYLVRQGLVPDGNTFDFYTR